MSEQQKESFFFETHTLTCRNCEEIFFEAKNLVYFFAIRNYYQEKHKQECKGLIIQ